MAVKKWQQEIQIKVQTYIKYVLRALILLSLTYTLMSMLGMMKHEPEGIRLAVFEKIE